MNLHSLLLATVLTYEFNDKYRQAEATYFADVKMTGNCMNSKQTSISVASSERLSLMHTQTQTNVNPMNTQRSQHTFW